MKYIIPRTDTISIEMKQTLCASGDPVTPPVVTFGEGAGSGAGL